MDKDAKEKEAREGRSMLTSPEALLGHSLLASGYFCLVLAADQEGLARKMTLAKSGSDGSESAACESFIPLLNK